MELRVGQRLNLKYKGREIEAIIINPHAFGRNKPSIGLNLRMGERCAGINGHVRLEVKILMTLLTLTQFNILNCRRATKNLLSIIYHLMRKTTNLVMATSQLTTTKL